MQKIILDTDIADDIDDAFALNYILENPDTFDLLGVVTTFKNPLERARIAKKILRLCGKENIGVYLGSKNPLNSTIHPFHYEEVDEKGTIHLLSYKPELEGEKVESENGIDFIISTIKKYPNEVMLIGIGPLTNIAKVILKDSSIKDLIKAIVVMGSFQSKNSNHLEKEWNVLVDPEASKVVYESGIPLRIVGGDITCLSTLTQEELDEVRAARNPSASYINEMLEEWMQANKRMPVLHDCLPISSLVSDQYLTFKKVRVKIPLEKEARGTSVITFDDTSNALMACGFNRNLFIKDFLTLYKKGSM